MNQQLRVQLNTYKRALENRRMQSFMYSFLLVFILVVLDVFGIHSLYKITMRKFRTYSELTKLVTDLENKGKNYEELRAKMEESRFYLSRLESAIPTEPNVEEFAVGIVESAAKYGLKHRKLNKLNGTDEYVDVRVTLQGASSQIQPFIKEIEGMDRLSVIRKFDYVKEVDTTYLQVVLRVYYLDR